MLLIQNARVVDPLTSTDAPLDVLIDGERIAGVGAFHAQDHPGWTVLDASGLVCAPGLMDAHVHFRDPGFPEKEDIFTGAAAAARGGVTRVVCMANTKPVVDTPKVLRYCLDRGRKTGIDVMQCACVTQGMRGEHLAPLEQLAGEGAAGFTDDGLPILNETLLLEAMQRAKALDLPLSLHEEDPAFVFAPGVNRGKVSSQLGYGGADALAEDFLVARDCMLALHSGASICIQHISSARSVELVRLAKKLGADIHAEATPHHFTLTEDAVLTYGTNARMNPPLRTAQDREAIIEGLKDGTIDLIVTDHAPHAAEEKAKPLPDAPSGITGLETSLALGIFSLVIPGHLSLLELLEKMCVAPAKLYRKEPSSIQEGAFADLILFGEREMWTAGNFASRASNSPFVGWELPGKLHLTMHHGQVLYHGA